MAALDGTTAIVTGPEPASAPPSPSPCMERAPR